jgi:hypothetical protein
MKLKRLIHCCVHLLRGGFDCIFFDSVFGPSIFFLSLLAKLRRIPILIRSRGGLGNEFAAQYGLKWYGKLYDCILVRIGKKNYQMASHIFAVSDYHKNQISQLGIPVRRITTLPNPLPEIQYLQENGCESVRTKLGLSPEVKIILIVTNFNYSEKFGPVIEYLAPIVAIVQDMNNWQVVILGHGKYLPEVKKRIIEFGYEHQVHCVGFFRDMISAYCDSACVLYLTGLDSAANVVVEAQYYKKCLIVNAYEALLEFIDSSLVPVVQGPEQLKTVLRKVMEDHGYRSFVAQQGHNFIIQKLDKKQLQQTLYNRLYSIV